MKFFVACSSSNDIYNRYLVDSKIYLDTLLREHDLVFGAYNAGIMGIAYDVAIDNNRSVIGACPSVYKNDLINIKCDKEIITDDILTRTKTLIDEADALIFLPGGIGTILELVAAIDKKRSNEIDKPLIIYNINNFFDELFSFFEKIYCEKFSSEKIRECYYFTNSADDTLTYINNYYKNIAKTKKKNR